MLLNERWIHEPEFLLKEAYTWSPCVENIPEIAEDDIEVKSFFQTHHMEISLDGMSMSSHLFSRFSSWFKLKKAVVWLQRFKKWFLYRFRRIEEYNPGADSEKNLTFANLRPHPFATPTKYIDTSKWSTIKDWALLNRLTFALFGRRVS